MSNIPSFPARLRAVVILLVLALAVFGPTQRAAAQNSSPPERMTYQGFLADGNGVALATNAPKNYDVEFRIYDAPTSGSNYWGETQTVTVDKGYFSVLLGEGTALTPPGLRNLSTIFAGATVSDRYIEMTVKGIGAGGAPVTMLPRIRLLSSPYSYLAQNAARLVSPNGSNLVTAANGALTINGSLSVGALTATTLTGSGASLTGLTPSQIPTLDGSKITGNLDGSKINAGTLDGSRIAPASIDLARLVAEVQQSLCPVGTIMAYAGDTAPSGWLLCNGNLVSLTTYSNLYTVVGTRFGINGANFYLPDFRGRFLRGRDFTAGRDPDVNSRTAMNPGGAAGNAVGSVQLDQFKSHVHTETRWIDTGNDPLRSNPTGDGSGQLETANTGASGGNETRPLNAYVNYIIKY